MVIYWGLNAFISSGLLWEWETDRNVSEGIINILDVSASFVRVNTLTEPPGTKSQHLETGQGWDLGCSYKVVNLPPWWQFGNTNIKWFVLLFVRVTDTIYQGRVGADTGWHRSAGNHLLFLCQQSTLHRDWMPHQPRIILSINPVSRLCLQESCLGSG